jgi:hypothetical protein
MPNKSADLVLLFPPHRAWMRGCLNPQAIASTFIGSASRFTSNNSLSRYGAL